jgi:hypothetical protein
LTAVTACLSSLRRNLSGVSLYSDMAAKAVASYPLDPPVDLDIVVCTTGSLHLVDLLPMSDLGARHRNTNAEPMLTGFECQSVLADGLGNYDWYCYMEDDTIVEDSLFIDKLSWLQEQADASALLQPNRFETAAVGKSEKLYIDGPINHDEVAPHQELRDQPELHQWGMGRSLRFIRPLNPHAGCYFLTATQMETWAKQPHFLDRDTSFVGPLESAATLGLIKTFRIYKPAPENATFLEVRHHDDHWWELAHRTFAWPKASAEAGPLV